MSQESSEHPALKNMNSTIETVKETGFGALKGAGYGAVIGGVGAAALGTVVGTAVGSLGFLAGPLGFITAPLGAAAGGAITGLAGGVVGGAIMGAKVGGVIGGVRGLAGAGEVIEKKQQQLIDNYERNEMRQERREAVSMRQQATRMQLSRQGAAMGVSPDSLPRGAEAGAAMGRG